MFPTPTELEIIGVMRCPLSQGNWGSVVCSTRVVCVSTRYDQQAHCRTTRNYKAFATEYKSFRPVLQWHSAALINPIGVSTVLAWRKCRWAVASRLGREIYVALMSLMKNHFLELVQISSLAFSTLLAALSTLSIRPSTPAMKSNIP